MKYLLCLLVFMVGCTTTQVQSVLTNVEAGACTVDTAAANTLSASFQSVTGCRGAAAITAAFKTGLDNSFFCSRVSTMKARLMMSTGGALAGLICPSAVNIAIGYATSYIPANFECPPSISILAAGEAAMVAACELLPF
jgi:hypothetical protein